MSGGRLEGALTRVALIDMGQVHALAGRLLDGVEQGGDGRAIVSVGG